MGHPGHAQGGQSIELRGPGLRVLRQQQVTEWVLLKKLTLKTQHSERSGAGVSGCRAEQEVESRVRQTDRLRRLGHLPLGHLGWHPAGAPA